MADVTGDVWLRAVKIYNQFTQDSKKKIDTTNLGSNHPLCSLRELAQATKKAQEKCYGARNPWLKGVRRVIQALHKFAPVIDSFVQNQPHITALVWGSFRFLIQVAAEEFEIGEKIGKTLVSILSQISRYEEEVRLFATFPRVIDTVSELFAHILNYLVSAIEHFSKPNAKRAASAAFSSRFEDILDTIREHTATLDREIRTASERRRLLHWEVQIAEILKQRAFQKELRTVYHLHDLANATQSIKLENIQAEQARLFEGQTETHEAMLYFHEVIDAHMRGKTAISVMSFGGQTHITSPASTSENKRRSIVQWLRRGITALEDVPEPESGTCEWLQDHPIYREWQDSGSNRCLWIYGISGCGKSVLAGRIARSAPSDIVLVHSCPNSAGRNSTKAAAVVISLILQLCENPHLAKEPCFRSILEDMSYLVGPCSTGIEVSLSILLEFLTRMMDIIQDFTVVIDALDQCTDLDECTGLNDPPSQLLVYIRDLALRPEASVVVLSRYHPILEGTFKGHFHLHMDRNLIEPDIMHFANQEIERHAKLHMLRKEILDKISMHSQGMFLWARIVLDDLRRSRTTKERRTKLKGFPSGLFAVYKQQLDDNGARLTEEEANTRSEIFLLMVVAIEPLKIDDIAFALAQDDKTNSLDVEDVFDDPKAEILRTCQPFVMAFKDEVHFIHTSVKEFLLKGQLSEEDSNAFLARKCLSKLSQQTYQSWKFSADLLRKHLLAGSAIALLEAPTQHICKESVFYNYACLHWHEHVTSLAHPSEDILRMLRQFITGNELVAWSEVLADLKAGSGIGPQVRVKVALVTWYNQLSSADKWLLPIKDFFVTSHEQLSEELHNKAEDELLPFLPLIRLGNYFNTGGRSEAEWQRAYDYKKRVAAGYRRVLGTRNPIYLRAATAMYQEYFWQKRFAEAERGLAEVSEVQHEVLGEQEADYFLSLQLLGLAQYSLNKYSDALSTLRRCGAGLYNLVGGSSPLFLITELYEGYVLDRLGDLSGAYLLYDDIWVQWVSIHGTNQPFSLMVQTAIGSIYRKRREYEDAERVLLEAYGERQRIFTIDTNLSVDSVIQLAILYRESGRGEKAIELLDEISASVVFATDFERSCQVIHIRALIDFDSGLYDQPRLSLLRLLDEATGEKRNNNNRELLWVRVNLADILRQRDDSNLALMLFAELVEPADDPSIQGQPGSPSLAEEPELREHLVIAERALRLVKDAQPENADMLLRREGFQWKREEDFWILQGGPITDTASMVAPKLDNCVS